MKGAITKIALFIPFSAEAGIVQLAELLLVKQTNEMMRKPLIRLKAYLQDKKL